MTTFRRACFRVGSIGMLLRELCLFIGAGGFPVNAGVRREVVCQVSINKKVAEAIDEVAYKVKLNVSVRCPNSSAIQIAPPNDGVDIVSVELESTGRNGEVVRNSLTSHNTVLLAGTEVPRCVAATERVFRNIDFDVVFDRRVMQRLPVRARVRLLFESICNDAKKGAIVTRFYSQSVDVKNVQP